VRNILIDSYPELYLKIERSSIFPHHGLQKFIRSSQHRELGDEQLSKAVMHCRWLFGLAITSWLVFATGIFFSA
jgi:hypothetical protein